jgi:hypothetical protein
MSKIKLIDDDDMLIHLEMNDGVPFIHLELWQWNLRVYKKLYLNLHLIREGLRTKGYDLLGAYNVNQDDKWRKFVEHMGFTKRTEHNGLDVYAIEV